MSKNWKAWLWMSLIATMFVVIIMGFIAYYNGRDRHPGYQLSLQIDPLRPSKPLRMGFAALRITPQIREHWYDNNGDARYDPRDGDSFRDYNRNGKFDAYWLAGFESRRAANGVHDDLWVRALVIDDGQTRLAIASLDLLGLLHSNILSIRLQIPESAGITHSILCSTHNHQAPDLLGFWGESPVKSGVNREYLQFVERQAARAMAEAATHLRPTTLRFVTDTTGQLAIMHATDTRNGQTLGTLVVGDYTPQTLWKKNLFITSDFAHYLREYTEKGIYSPGLGLVEPGLGGITVFVSAATKSTLPPNDQREIINPITAQSYTTPSFEKARALGLQLAQRVLQAVRQDTLPSTRQAGIALRAKSFDVPVQSKSFRAGVALGVVEAGYTSWGYLRSEATAFSLGDASFIAVPAARYPLGASAKTPPPGKYPFVLGLANDDLGYLMFGPDGAPFAQHQVPPAADAQLYETLQDLLKSLPAPR
ncbi:hypothetical protein GCM10027275_55010 [Rhabdobacter roseus]|uniref:Neutral/alkaline non-lysosomal ceramidase N-terminal domain-containing protein n=1 Tax=Rhabdobacter roseus TaxID=1655419 RepID=A0A840TSZ8_9BACT|nr:hypothetical protein [Rhabdobacter roseus]MBB5287516.1 hypothetical protein [Rhabdobacter roseus]